MGKGEGRKYKIENLLLLIMESVPKAKSKFDEFPVFKF